MIEKKSDNELTMEKNPREFVVNIGIGQNKLDIFTLMDPYLLHEEIRRSLIGSVLQFTVHYSFDQSLVHSKYK